LVLIFTVVLHYMLALGIIPPVSPPDIRLCHRTIAPLPFARRTLSSGGPVVDLLPGLCPSIGETELSGRSGGLWPLSL
jgi:hypothetical protein